MSVRLLSFAVLVSIAIALDFTHAAGNRDLPAV
jgi:hypothetical protein